MNNFFTIGYQGRGQAEMLSLIQDTHDVNILVDVRASARSIQSDFRGEALGRSCNSRGMKYCHEPALGVPFQVRELIMASPNLESLRPEYLKIMDANGEDLERLAGLIQSDQNRACLMCFERDPEKCHRSVLAERLVKLTGRNVVHLFNPWSGRKGINA